MGEELVQCSSRSPDPQGDGDNEGCPVGHLVRGESPERMFRTTGKSDRSDSLAERLPTLGESGQDVLVSFNLRFYKQTG